MGLPELWHVHVECPRKHENSSGGISCVSIQAAVLDVHERFCFEIDPESFHYPSIFLGIDQNQGPGLLGWSFLIVPFNSFTACFKVASEKPPYSALIYISAAGFVTPSDR